MKALIKSFALKLCVLLPFLMCSQEETWNWCFGYYAGVNFSTNPPTHFNTPAITVTEGNASISDRFGNLLMYTDGVTVWNNQHQVMANGTGLIGGNTSSQAAIIIKDPVVPTLYYVFTLQGSTGSLAYSTVNMTLAAGLGSVTAKNVSLTITPLTEKMTASGHCNGKDSWVLVHDWASNNFRAFLISSAGVSTTAVVSGVGSVHGVLNGPAPEAGCMKISPDGKKLAVTRRFTNTIELFDFDNSTGLVSNPIQFSNLLFNQDLYGCEFSPDGTKLYASGGYSGYLLQWDLCAGTPLQISASAYTVALDSTTRCTLQNASNGKIYVARDAAIYLGAINNPNAIGAACNYIDTDLYIETYALFGLPNFSTDFFRLRPSVFSYAKDTNYCAAASFSVPSPISLLPGSSCVASNYSVLGYSWDFDDIQSGAANSSTLAGPHHVFSSPGTYNVKLAVNFNCHTDTLRQVVSFTNTAPSLSVSGDVFLCEGENTVLLGMGATSYSWNGNPGTNTIAVTNPSANTVFTLSGILNGNLCVGQKAVMVTVSKCTSLAENIPNKSIRFYPNPASTNLNIESDSKTAIKIYNSLGQFVSRLELNPGKNEMSTVSLSNGLYFFKTENCETCEVSQLVIHRE